MANQICFLRGKNLGKKKKELQKQIWELEQTIEDLHLLLTDVTNDKEELEKKLKLIPGIKLFLDMEMMKNGKN